jgi:hypothetical protein
MTDVDKNIPATIVLAIVAFFVICFASQGCGVPPPSPHAMLPDKDHHATPYILWLGDETLSTMVKTGLPTHPLWIDGTTSTLPLETSAEMLARLPSLLKKYPEANILHIQMGEGDFALPGDSPGSVCGPTTPSTCDNLNSMTAIGKAAGLKVYVGTLFPVGPVYPSSSQAIQVEVNALTANAIDVSHGIEGYNRILLIAQSTGFIPDIDAVIDYGSLLANETPSSSTSPAGWDPDYTGDGLNPNVQGDQMILNAAMSVFITCRCGYPR